MKKIFIIFMYIHVHNVYAPPVFSKVVSSNPVRKLPATPVKTPLTHSEVSTIHKRVLPETPKVTTVAPKVNTVAPKINVQTLPVQQMPSKINGVTSKIMEKFDDIRTGIKSTLVSDKTAMHSLGLSPKKVVVRPGVSTTPEIVQNNPSILTSEKLKIAEVTPLTTLVKQRWKNAISIIRNEQSKPLILHKPTNANFEKLQNPLHGSKKNIRFDNN